MKIIKPTIIIDKQKCIANIKAMALKARNNKVFFRPHFKTHQSAEIGEWFRDEGIKAITVSSVTMAEYFAENEWNDITIAFTVNINEIECINKLAQKIKINLLVDNTETLHCIIEKMLHEVGIFIKIDTGYHRTGVEWNNFHLIDTLTTLIKSSPKLKFKGFLTHNGNTYAASSKEEIANIFNSSREKLLMLKTRYINEFNDIIISLGDTPS
ncbi:MAG: alanine racemase, partial [Bacteroidota bacterium]